MKKLLLATLLLLSFSSRAQYHPMLDSINRWNLVTNYIPVRLSQQTGNCFYPVDVYLNSIQTEEDTVFNSNTYKKVVGYSDFYSCTIGFVREDTAAQRVYFVNNLFQSEELLYDFSLTTGNTVLLNFYQPSGYYSSGQFTVDSISQIATEGGLRKMIWLSNHLNFPATSLQWIEGTGSPEHPIYSYAPNDFGGLLSNCGFETHNFSTFVSCFYHDSRVYFDSCAYATAISNGCFFVGDSCYYGNICGGITENNSIQKIEIFPNPATSFLQLDIAMKTVDDVQFDLLDLNGRQVQPFHSQKLQIGTTKIRFELNQHAGGVYLLRCKSGQGIAYQKILIH